MLGDTEAFSGFAVKDLDAARRFYGEKLGLTTTIVEADEGLMQLELAGGRNVFVYEQPDSTPASYTILNFPVSDVEATVDELGSRGVEFERYEGFDQDEKGIARGPGPEIAWFQDPSGNVLSVLAQQ